MRATMDRFKESYIKKRSAQQVIKVTLQYYMNKILKNYAEGENPPIVLDIVI